MEQHLDELHDEPDGSDGDSGEVKQATQSEPRFVPDTAERDEQRLVARFLGLDIEELSEMTRDKAWKELVERANRAAQAGITFER